VLRSSSACFTFLLYFVFLAELGISLQELNKRYLFMRYLSSVISKSSLPATPAPVNLDASEVGEEFAPTEEDMEEEEEDMEEERFSFPKHLTNGKRDFGSVRVFSELERVRLNTPENISGWSMIRDFLKVSGKRIF
jgi:hypothetical protein